MLIIFLKNSVDSKTKDKLSMETHKHAPLFCAVVVDFTDDFVDELFCGLKLLSLCLYLSLLAIQCIAVSNYAIQ